MFVLCGKAPTRISFGFIEQLRYTLYTNIPYVRMTGCNNGYEY